MNQVAMEMLLTGKPISAHEALLHGLVSKVVPEARLEEETLAVARRVCQSSRPVVALGKATFYRYRSPVRRWEGLLETGAGFFPSSAPDR